LASIDTAALVNSDKQQLQYLQQAIEQSKIFYLHGLELSASSQNVLTTTRDNLKKIIAVAHVLSMDVMIRIQGYSDSRGQPQIRKLVSLERAESIRSYLIEQGINKEILIPQSMVNELPAVEKTQQEKDYNRRVDFKINLLKKM